MVHRGHQLAQLLSAEHLQGHQSGGLIDAAAAQQVGDRRMPGFGRVAEADHDEGSFLQLGREGREEARLLLGEPLGLLDDQEHWGLSAATAPSSHSAARARAVRC